MRPEYPVDLAEEAVQVLDLGDRECTEREVDGVGTEERQIREVALVPLDAHVLANGSAARPFELGQGGVDADRDRALLGERDGGLAGSGAEVEDALARDVADQPQLVLGGAVGAVAHDVGGRVGVRSGRDAVPALGVAHPVIVRPAARVCGVPATRRPRTTPPSRGLPRRGTAPVATS
jgi:hypothetical protein